MGRKTASHKALPTTAELSDNSSDSESSEAPDDSTDESDTEDILARDMDLIASFLSKFRTMTQESKQVPFLIRNLRAGFANRCKLLGVPESTNGETNVHVTFRVLMDHGLVKLDYPDEHSLTCPLCNLHGNFKTKDMLQKHLEWDHPEVETRWTLEVSCHLSETLEF